MRYQDLIIESAPNTLLGSFSPDLVQSKKWLCKNLKKILKDKSAGIIFILGSWYGNLALFLESENILYDNMVMVEKNKKLLEKTKKFLKLYIKTNNIRYVNIPAENVVYPNSSKILVINTSTNEMTTDWFENVPDGELVVIQGKNMITENTKTVTKDFETFKSLFPLRQVIFSGKINLEDPETEYTRYMVIGYK